jgi:CheY-like chemotaxis protein
VQPLTVVLADDHPILREGVAACFDEHPDLHIVGQCSDGLAAVEMIKALAPDFAIIDLQLPKLHGLEVIQKLREADSPSKLSLLQRAISRSCLHRSRPPRRSLTRSLRPQTPSWADFLPWASSRGDRRESKWSMAPVVGALSLPIGDSQAGWELISRARLRTIRRRSLDCPPQPNHGCVWARVACTFKPSSFGFASQPVAVAD